MSLFNERLKILRTQFKITQPVIASELNITLRQYQRFESLKGDFKPSYDVLVLISDFFYVSTDYLLGRSDEPQHDYYFQKTHKILTQNMPKPFIDLLTYATNGGITKTPPLLNDKFNLLNAFKNWKELIFQFNESIKKRTKYREKEEKIYYENSSKNISYIESVHPKVYGLWDLFKEKIIHNIENPYHIVDYDRFVSPNEPYLEYSLQKLINYETCYTDSLTNETWYIPPIPKVIGTYLYPLTINDLNLL